MIELDQPLAAGMEGEHVEELQRRLAHLGDYEGEVDGRYGDKTETAVKQFQGRSGKPEDGTTDREVWETLDREAQFAGFDPYAARQASSGNKQVHDQYQDGTGHGQQQDPSGASQSTAAGQLSDDGQWRWDGTDWRPVDGQQHQPNTHRQQAASASVPDGAHRSEDGNWWWDGHDWQPVHATQRSDGNPAHGDQHQAAGAGQSSAGQLSEDGRWRWDGTDWRPVEDQLQADTGHMAQQQGQPVAQQQPAQAQPSGTREGHAADQHAHSRSAHSQHPTTGANHPPVAELPPLDPSIFDGEEFEEFRQFLLQNQRAGQVTDDARHQSMAPAES